MKKLRIPLCALLACGLLLSLAACGSTQKSDISLDDVVIAGAETAAPTASAQPSGVYAVNGDVTYRSALYLLFMQNAFSDIQSSGSLSYDAVLDASVNVGNGSTATGSQYIAASAQDEFHWMWTIDQEYARQGLRVEDSDYYRQAVSSAKTAYTGNQAFYDYFGITQDDLQKYYMYSYQYNDLFYYFYGEGGKEEIPVSDLESLMSDGAYRIEYIYLPFSDPNTGDALTSADIAQRRDLAQTYLDRYNAGEDFSDLVYESYQFLDPATTRTADTTYDTYIAKSGGSFPADMESAAAALSEGEAKLVDTGDYVAVVLRLPVNGAEGKNWRRAALQLAYDASYGDDFNAYMTGLYDKADIQYNETEKALLTPEYYYGLLQAYYKTAG